MKITPALRREINAAVRQHVRKSSPLAEVGYRDVNGRRTANCLLWPEDSDLWDKRRLSETSTIEDDPAHPGYAELDLYVYAGRGHDRELETNVGILIRDGHVVGSHHEGTKLTALKRTIDFPIVPWDHT
jgi:hypothetical protein